MFASLLVRWYIDVGVAICYNFSVSIAKGIPMAKAASPVRLQQDLMDNATVEGELFNRSAAEQVEYWAGIGRRLSNVVESDTLLSISAGLATIYVEPVQTQPIEPGGVFNALDKQRESGALTEMIKQGGQPRYQASKEHPGYLERIEPDGQVVLGQFSDGAFKTISVAK